MPLGAGYDDAQSAKDPMMHSAPVQDVVIIGAGPAGLTAAIYLGRFRRPCWVLEDDTARARWIPVSHNIPGFKAGIGGFALLDALRAQASSYGAEIRRAHVTSVTIDDGYFVLSTSADVIRSRYLLLATGIEDYVPVLPGVPEAILRKLLRFCPICDGFEAIDQRIAVLSDGAIGEREAAFLQTYSRHITLIHIGESDFAAPRDALEEKGIECIRAKLSDLAVQGDGVTLLYKDEIRRFDAVYLALGGTPRNGIARNLGAACDDKNALLVNPHNETSVTRLYAAGDVVHGLHQVAVAAAGGAIAATDIHNKLRAETVSTGAHPDRMGPSAIIDSAPRASSTITLDT